MVVVFDKLVDKDMDNMDTDREFVVKEFDKDKEFAVEPFDKDREFVVEEFDMEFVVEEFDTDKKVYLGTITNL